MTRPSEELADMGAAVHLVDTDGTSRRETSAQKLAGLIEFARRDRGTIGGIFKPLLMLPPVRKQLRELLQMPADQLDGILNNTIDFLAELRSDPTGQEASE